MKAVKDQKKKLERLSETFQNRFVKYVTSKFIQLGNELSVTGNLTVNTVVNSVRSRWVDVPETSSVICEFYGFLQEL